VDDARGSAYARTRAKHVLLIVDEDGQLPPQDVEGVGVPPMEVRIRAGPSALEVGFGDAELPERRLDHDPSAEKDLALMGTVDDPRHAREYDDHHSCEAGAAVAAAATTCTSASLARG
jgi:hypothetical protein